MSKLPCFFFSYARKDHGPALNKFFKVLKERVGQKGLFDDEKGEVSFRDIDSIEPGGDWGQELSDALAKCLTMVSVFTPWYFTRPYCGKEFRVFLDRQGVTYDSEGCAQGSQKIVPVLWEKWSDLQRHNFPPSVTRFIQITAGRHEKLYRELGLRGIRTQKGASGPFAEILESIAGAVVDQAQQSPLSPLLQAPSLAETLNAFDRTDRSPILSEVGPNSLLLVYLTAGREAPTSRAARYGASHPGDWHPFGTSGAGGLHLLVRETAATLQFRNFVEPTYGGAHPKVTELVANLREATARNVISVVVLDPWFVAIPQGGATVKQILSDKKWNGGIVIPVDANDAETIRLIPTVEGSWHVSPADEQRILLVCPRGTIQEFQNTLLSTLTELEKRMAASGKVPGLPTGSGPSAPPSLRGPATRQQRG